MSDSPASILYDASGNPINVVTVGSEKHLAVSMKQNVVPSQNNDSTDNIGASATWTGTGETTLGVAGIQVNFIADKRCVVYVEQSIDNSNWDISDSVEVDPDHILARTFQATASYFRTRVVNLEASATTYRRQQVALCPIVEALPRSLSQLGNLRVSIQEQQQYADTSAGRAFSAIYEGIVDKAEIPFVLFRNPAANLKDAVISKLIVDIVTKGQSATCRFYVNPTVTAVGTALTIANRRLKDVPPSSTMLVYSKPTCSAFGTLAFSASPGASQNALTVDVQDGIIVGPGYDVLMTAVSTGVATGLLANMTWEEA